MSSRRGRLFETGDGGQEAKGERYSMPKKILRHRDLIVYRRAVEAAMRIFEISKSFPKEEIYSLTDQIRRSSRSIPANIAEA